MNLNKIVKEWSYRVHDGIPDVKNPLHMVELQRVLHEKKYPRKFIEALLSRLREEKRESGTVWKTAAGNWRSKNPQGDPQSFGRDKDKADKWATGEKVDNGEDQSAGAHVKLDSKQEEILKKDYEGKTLDDHKTDKQRLRHCTAKLMMVTAGNTDIKLTPEEIEWMNENMMISPRGQSGKYYLKPKDRGSISMRDRLGGSHMTQKHDLLASMKYLMEKYPDYKPKFKGAGGTELELTPDQLEKIAGHKATSFKPQDPDGFGVEGIPKKKAGEVLNQKEQDALREAGYDPDEVEIYGDRIDPDEPQTSVDASQAVVDSLRRGLDNPDISEDTKAYMKKFIGQVDAILKDPNLSPEEKLAAIKEQLGKSFKESFEAALLLGEDEARNLLKDFGEVATYLQMLAEGQQVYMPASGSFAVADLIRVSGDGDASPVKIDKISVKSKFGAAAEGAATSIIEVLSTAAKGLPEDDSRRKKAEDTQKLQQNNSTKADTSEMDSQTKKEVESVRSISSAGSIEEAEQAMQEAGLSDKEIALAKKRLERYLQKWGNRIDPPIWENGGAVLLQELTYRIYSGKKAQETMKEIGGEYPVDYIVVTIGEEGAEIDEHDRTKMDGMCTEDKGFPEHPKFENGKLVSLKYGHGNWGARPCSKRAKNESIITEIALRANQGKINNILNYLNSGKIFDDKVIEQMYALAARDQVVYDDTLLRIKSLGFPDSPANEIVEKMFQYPDNIKHMVNYVKKGNRTVTSKDLKGATNFHNVMAKSKFPTSFLDFIITYNWTQSPAAGKGEAALALLTKGAAKPKKGDISIGGKIVEVKGDLGRVKGHGAGYGEGKIGAQIQKKSLQVLVDKLDPSIIKKEKIAVPHVNDSRNLYQMGINSYAKQNYVYKISPILIKEKVASKSDFIKIYKEAIQAVFLRMNVSWISGFINNKGQIGNMRGFLDAWFRAAWKYYFSLEKMGALIVLTKTGELRYMEPGDDPLKKVKYTSTPSFTDKAGSQGYAFQIDIK
jgi:hypothetical protein